MHIRGKGLTKLNRLSKTFISETNNDLMRQLS